LTKFNFNIDFSISNQKSAKIALFNIGAATLKACGVADEVSFLGFKYNIANKLREEISKLDEATAQRALEEIKKELERI
jgi:hypothetical protein